jgi:small-conductance mechanosensitive channel
MLFNVVILAALLALRIFGEPILKQYSPGHTDDLIKLTTVALVVSAAFFIDQILRRIYWRGYLKRRSGRDTPKLVQDLVTVVIVAFAVASGLWWQEGLTLTGVAATTIAVAAAIGVALQPDIQDVFAGLAMNYENAYGIGDWVTIETVDTKEPIYGFISSLSWRSTFLTLESGSRVSVPNHTFTSTPVVNHSRPEGAKRLQVSIRLDSRVLADRVLDMLEGEALKATRQPGLARSPAPEALISEFGRDETIYWVWFWFYPGKISPELARSKVLLALQDLLLRNNLPLPVTQVEMVQPPKYDEALGTAELKSNLSQIDIFQHALDQNHLDALASRLTAVELPRGTVLMRQGDPPSSMYVILEGAVSITIAGNADRQQEVAVSATGDIVGEMSLLTGAPRTATATALTRVRVAEIAKSDVEELLHQSPELFERISHLLALRQLENNALLNSSQEPAIERDILAKMMDFFGWKLKRT